MGSWEDAVRWYRAQPNNIDAIRQNYFDLPVREAAKRYAASAEFAEVQRLLGQGHGSTLLDLGAGNGIASFALTQAGWTVTALEPDPSQEVGAEAIRQLARDADLAISVVQEWGEQLPFPDACFDAVFARQVLHHARDLGKMLREIARVTRHGGKILCIRDHVAESEGQLAAFLHAHPLHRHYGGENAFRLTHYRQAFDSAGLQRQREWGHLDSILNYYPGNEASRRFKASLTSCWKKSGIVFAWNPSLQRRWLQWAARPDRAPGRLVSFLAVKP